MSKFNIKYLPRKTIKGRALVDFVAEFLDFPPEAVAVLTGKSWVLFIYGSSCRASGGIGIHLVSPESQEYHHMVTLTFKMTNNKAKYEALVVGISIATTMEVTEVDVKSNSQVVVN